MWIFFFAVMLSNGEPVYLTYGTGPGHPHQFHTKAACEKVATQKMAEYNAAPIGVMLEHGCAKLAHPVGKDWV